MSQDIIAKIGALLDQRSDDTSPITAILMDDASCALIMAHRITQGLRLPKQNTSIGRSNRLAYLQALADNSDIEAARIACDGTEVMLSRINRFEKVEDPTIRALLISSAKKMMDPTMSSSFFVGQYLLYGEGRIAQESIPLHQTDTSTAEALSIIEALLQRPVNEEITISDRDDSEATNFIRVGKAPAHFSFPETASPRTGTNASLLHYEIDHPGGDMVFFTSPGGFGPLSDMMLAIEDRNPLYINEMPQLMAVNSLYLQEMGAFCVPSGDTCITMLLRDGVLTAAERPDLSRETDHILEALAGRGVTAAELGAMSDFLRRVEVEDDYDWEVVERLGAAHPDLLGYQSMDINMSRTFGISKDHLLAQAVELFQGDTSAAAEEVANFVNGAEMIELPAGRYHLYVPNLASKTRYEDALPALNHVSGREDADMIFVLADRALDLGDDPHLVATMRALPDTALSCNLECRL